MTVTKDANGHEIHIGDRVRVIDSFAGQYLSNRCGTVVQLKGANWTTNYEWNIGVAFDEYIGGHDLDGVCTEGYGRWGCGCEVAVIPSHLNEIKIEFNSLFN